MKTSFKLISLGLLLWSCFSSLFYSRPAIPEKLSEYGFFKGEMNQLIGNDRLIPYELNSSLFSDYAHKARFLLLPNGAKVNFQTKDVLDFPEGSILIKNFYYYNNEQQPNQGRRILETRLLIHGKDGWKAYPYVWNEEQTDANLEITGASIPVQFRNKKNQLVEFTYEVPNINQCKGCHEVDGKMSPIGPSVRQLNKSIQNGAKSQNQLQHLKELGHLEVSDEVIASAPKLVDYTNEKEAIDLRAKAYLDINCAHCHQPKGPAKNSGLNLKWDNEQLVTYGFMKSPVAAGRGSGNFQYDIVPGKAKESILWFRMNSTDPGIMMPELGRTMVHKEGVELIRKWIDQLK